MQDPTWGFAGSSKGSCNKGSIRVGSMMDLLAVPNVWGLRSKKLQTQPLLQFLNERMLRTP